MTMKLECLNCGKHFYISGEAEELFNKLGDASLYLHSMGYKTAGAPLWKSVEDRAKCCDSPDIITVCWKC